MIKKASFRIPYPLTTKRVWIGCYGGHFSIVVVFTQKPIKANGYYDTYTNKDIIAGTFNLDEFNAWFGTNIEPHSLEVEKVEQYDITAVWDEWNSIVVPNPKAD